jgi:hypothetical protein
MREATKTAAQSSRRMGCIITAISEQHADNVRYATLLYLISACFRTITNHHKETNHHDNCN